MSTTALNLDDHIVVSKLVSAGESRERAEGIVRMVNGYLELQAQRDALLAAAKTARLCARVEIVAGNKAWKGPADLLDAAIALCEKA